MVNRWVQALGTKGKGKKVPIGPAGCQTGVWLSCFCGHDRHSLPGHMCHHKLGTRMAVDSGLYRGAQVGTPSCEAERRPCLPLTASPLVPIPTALSPLFPSSLSCLFSLFFIGSYSPPSPFSVPICLPFWLCSSPLFPQPASSFASGLSLQSPAPE